MAMLRGLALVGAVAFVLGAQPALADVKAGVDAWSRGDYALAVREWQGPAEAGDADAMFNLAQAYRLGRGVPADEARAETYYARAAAKGHVQAADTYGLMLFQSGRRELALPYVEDAARRGDPRSEYLLGIAYFNGDLVPKDWVKAYALLTLANSAGLPQAAPALAQMDASVPLTQRQQAAGLAEQMRAQANAARGRELATAELAAGPSEMVTSSRPPIPTPSSRIPRPIPEVAVSPSISAARAAVAEAARVTGTANPAEAGADFARPNVAAPAPVAVARPEPTPASTPTPAQSRQVAARRPPPAPARTSNGPWRVQLGAFSVAGNADRLWTRLSGRAELAGRTKLKIPAGRVIKLQAGGFATQAQADAACRALKSAGQDCLVTTR
jgi:hypothetical protein